MNELSSYSNEKITTYLEENIFNKEYNTINFNLRDGITTLSIDENYKTSFVLPDEIIKEIREMTHENLTADFGLNFDFGIIKADYIRMSPFGVAIREGNKWFSYDVKTAKMIEVGGLTFKLNGMFYKMPVATNQIAVGDMILHKGRIVYVIDLPNKDVEKGIVVADICKGEQCTILPTTNMFGFNFITKIVCLMDTGMFGAPTANQPFGNLMPLMMLTGDNGFLNDGDMSKFMIMMSMMNGKTNPFANMFAGIAPSAPETEDNERATI